tara:strand:+ start:1847 stop:3394 length:1548 start_codon:yes stop_codon:yes gene_type:complete
MKTYMHLIAFILASVSFAQEEVNALPTQVKAIYSLSASSAISEKDLSYYIASKYGKKVIDLTQPEAAEIIVALQSGTIELETIKTPIAEQNTTAKPKALEMAAILEPGMSKLFHFRDRSVRQGTIESVEDEIVVLITKTGKFRIPKTEFLSETADVTIRNGERYNGIVLAEKPESFLIRTNFGDATIQKTEIVAIKRFHGGIMAKESEDKRKFYQGDQELIHIFRDPTAFPLRTNTAYISGLSIGYGLTDRFMITSRFGSNFAGDINLHPRMQFYHRKTAKRERAMAYGFGFHRNYPVKSIVGKYSHAVKKISKTETPNPSEDADVSSEYLNNTEELSLSSALGESDATMIYAEFYLVYSSRRVNPNGRGKIGYNLGIKTSNAFYKRNSMLAKPKSSSSGGTGIVNTTSYEWDQNALYAVPFRAWLSLEYDLRKDLKFLASTWIDNGWKSKSFGEVLSDYTGDDNSSAFTLDAPGGKSELFDFDFGFMYAMNESFRIGVHFNQPYIDFYWEFYEF